MGFSENENTENKSAGCCVFSPEIVATGSGFSSWVNICFIASSESCSLDVELLAALQHLLVAQPTEHQVSGCWNLLFFFFFYKSYVCFI